MALRDFIVTNWGGIQDNVILRRTGESRFVEAPYLLKSYQSQHLSALNPVDVACATQYFHNELYALVILSEPKLSAILSRAACCRSIHVVGTLHAL